METLWIDIKRTATARVKHNGESYDVVWEMTDHNESWIIKRRDNGSTVDGPLFDEIKSHIHTNYCWQMFPAE